MNAIIRDYLKCQLIMAGAYSADCVHISCTSWGRFCGFGRIGGVW